jgi:hypothetical protein
MADDQESRGGGPEDLGQDPYVERLRPDPSQPPEAVRILEGLLGDSDREGYKRLYFTRELDHHAEFRTEDVVFSEPIPSDQPPFLGQRATRVGIRREATIEYTRLRTPRPADEFDLDVRLGAPDVSLAAPGELGAEAERRRCTAWETGCNTQPPPRGHCPRMVTKDGATCRGSSCGCTRGGEWTCVTCPTCDPKGCPTRLGCLTDEPQCRADEPLAPGTC